MINIWNAIGIVFCALAAVLVLKEIRKEWTPYILILLCIMVFTNTFPLWQEVSSWFHRIGNEEQGYGNIVLKAFGVALLTELGCEICKSAGETGIAGYVAWIGKAEILWLSFPLFQKLVNLAVDFAI